MADIYAAIASCQQNGNRLLDEVKEKLSAEVKKITKEEIKGLKRIYACEYFELAFYLGGVLLLEHAGGHIVPNSPYMKNLVHAVIGNHFSLYDNGDELEDDETLSPSSVMLNGRVGNHFNGLPFIENVPDEAGGFDKDGHDAFGLYCETSHLKSNEHWANIEKPKIETTDWKAVHVAALSLFNIMQTLTSDLWHKLCKKKEDAVKAGRVKEFLGISKIDSANKKLDDAMEVEGDDNETMKSMMGKELDKKLNKAKAKEKKEKRKNSSAGGKNQPQGPTKTGQSGIRDTNKDGKEKRPSSKKKWKRDSSSERGPSPKRGPPRDYHHWHDNDSYHNRGRRRSKSRPRHIDNDNDERDHNNRRPHSILKKNVRFPAEGQRGRGRGGRGRRGGRGGRGDARDGYKRERGSRT